MLTVACVYKPGRGFTQEYVARLAHTVSVHCKAPYEFVCLTTERLRIDGVRNERILCERPGFWNKLELFRRGLFAGPVVYVDLDTLILNDVTDIFTYPHGFTTGSNWLRPGRMASGMLAWDGTQDLHYLFEGYRPQHVREYAASWACFGDQGYIEKHLKRESARFDDLFPGRLVSYKYHVRKHGRVPEGASIVMFHGRPRPHEVNWKLPE